jgi:hypothetical protein
MELQQKWDIFLMTAWYKTPGMSMLHAKYNFLNKYQKTQEDCIELRRFPWSYASCMQRVQPWICCNLPKLSTILWERDMSDIFDLADKLKTSKMDCVGGLHRMMDKNERYHAEKLTRQEKRLRKAQRIHCNNYTSRLRSNQWLITK